MSETTENEPQRSVSSNINIALDRLSASVASSKETNTGQTEKSSTAFKLNAARQLLGKKGSPTAPKESDKRERNVATREDLSPATDENFLWSVSYNGILASACSEGNGELYTVYLSSPDSNTVVPRFKLQFKTPLSAMTHISLPGGKLVLQFSRSNEVSMWRMDGEGAHKREEELTRLQTWFERVVMEDSQCASGLATIVADIRGATDDHVFSVEALCAKCEETDEAFVVMTFFKFLVDSSADHGAANAGRIGTSNLA